MGICAVKGLCHFPSSSFRSATVEEPLCLLRTVGLAYFPRYRPLRTPFERPGSFSSSPVRRLRKLHNVTT